MPAMQTDSLVHYFSYSGAFNGLFEVLKFDVRVDFRGVQIAMAKKLLHVTNAGAATQKMSRAAVTKGVH